MKTAAHRLPQCFCKYPTGHKPETWPKSLERRQKKLSATDSFSFSHFQLDFTLNLDRHLAKVVHGGTLCVLRLRVMLMRRRWVRPIWSSSRRPRSELQRTASRRSSDSTNSSSRRSKHSLTGPTLRRRWFRDSALKNSQVRQFRSRRDQKPLHHFSRGTKAMSSGLSIDQLFTLHVQPLVPGVTRMLGLHQNLEPSLTALSISILRDVLVYR